MHAPTGEQFRLTGTWGTTSTEAVVTELAAGIRTLTVGGRHLTEPFPEIAKPSFGNGIVLVPWPNRVRDGLWRLDGEDQQLDLTEPKLGNAIHGLLRNTAYRVAERSSASVTLAATVFPQHGYPFLLETSVRYEVQADGLLVTHSIRNRSEAAAPVAVGAHPFLRVGDTPIEDLTVEVKAATRFETDARQNPTGEHPVAGTDYDLRTGRRVGDLSLDTAFGGVELVDGVGRHRLTAPDGRWVELWQDDNFGYAQVFTAPAFRREDGEGLAVAIEPMTAPPNALVSGSGLRWLVPGESWTLSWGIRTGRQNA
ncbi:MAG: aldose 1-epimerase family protein [Homoserinimonas sp.]